MMELYLLVLLVISHCGLINADCTFHKNVIDCRNLGLKEIPTFKKLVNRTIVHLNFNDITVIPEDAFVSLSDTWELQIYLDHNSINTVEKGALGALENVTVRLFLDQNNLTNGLPEELSQLNKLTHLSIDNIDSMEETVTGELGNSLEHLSLGMRNFPVWPSPLQHLRHLNTLKLSDIPFGKLPTNAFDGFNSSLEFLEISSSKWNSRLKAICSLSNLQALTFEHVVTEDISKLLPSCKKSLNSVWMLSLQAMNLGWAPNVSTLFPSLERLEISRNPHLTYLPEDLVDENNTVTALLLYENNLKQVPYVIQKMTKLEFLNLANNSIEVIEGNDLGHLPRLKALILTANKLLQISHLAFNFMPSLHRLMLVDTSLELLPQAIGPLTNATIIDFGKGQDMCSCDMAWIKNTNLMKSIQGTCKDSAKELDIVKFVTAC